MDNAADGAEKVNKLIKSGTFLDCRCPHCGKSVIENERIKLGVINHGHEHGILRLSPYLNYHDLTSTIRLEDWQPVQDVLCPHCVHSFRKAEERCGECGSEVARVVVKAAGEIFGLLFCLRKNCHWHGLDTEARGTLSLEAAGFTSPRNQKEFVQTGTKLKVSCPRCHANLVHGEDLLLHARNADGRLFVVRLSPLLNVFTCECSIFLSEGEEVADMICPKCDQSLWLDGKHCDACGARAARMRVGAAVQEVDFYICMRNRCHWHGLSTEDRRRIILDESANRQSPPAAKSQPS